MSDEIWYVVDGVNPEPWESPEGSVARKAGKMYVQMHKPFKLRAFQEDFAQSFKEQNDEWTTSEEEMALTFYVWRNVDHLIKANIADATNMQKAIEDALQGILYKNDRQVQDVRTLIVAQDNDVEPAVVIQIRPWPGSAVVLSMTAAERLAARRSKPKPKPDADPRQLEHGDSFF